MRKVLLIGMGGFGLLSAGIALAGARWDFSMDGGGKETWIDFLPIPLIAVGLPVTVIAASVAGITAVTKVAYSLLSRPGEAEPRYGVIIAIFFCCSFACLAILYLATKL